MTKGCFFKTVVIVTIVIGAIVYVVQYKLTDWIIKPGMKHLSDEILKNLEREVGVLSDSAEKDSLMSLMKFYFEHQDIVNLNNELFLNEYKLVIEDSIVTQEELTTLTLLLKKEKNEKSKINRN